MIPSSDENEMFDGKPVIVNRAHKRMFTKGLVLGVMSLNLGVLAWFGFDIFEINSPLKYVVYVLAAIGFLIGLCMSTRCAFQLKCCVCGHVTSKIVRNETNRQLLFECNKCGAINNALIYRKTRE